MRRRAEAFDVINVLICVFAGFVTLFPFYRVFITSFVSFKEYITTPVILFPKQWTLQAYKMIFQTDQLAISLRNTTFITVFGTLISLSLTALMAYPMSKSRLPGIKVLNYFIRLGWKDEKLISTKQTLAFQMIALGFVHNRNNEG